MLEPHEEDTCHFACQWTASRLQFCEKIGQSITHTFLKLSDGYERWPVLVILRNLRVGLLHRMRTRYFSTAIATYVTFTGVIYIRINAAFEDVLHSA